MVRHFEGFLQAKDNILRKPSSSSQAELETEGDGLIFASKEKIANRWAPSLETHGVGGRPQMGTVC